MSIHRRIFAGRDKSFDSKIIRVISFLLVILIISIAAMYYSNMRQMYSVQLKQTNDSLTEQVAVSYETMLKNITDSVYKIPLYDDDLINQIRNYKSGSEYRLQLFNKLSSIVLGNQYLFSAYLYCPGPNTVYNTDSGTVSSIEEFSDKPVFHNKSIDRIYLMDPRLVETSSLSKRLLMSVVLPVPLSSLGADSVLVVNIDAGRLYNDILHRISTQNNMALYVYNSAGTILISKDQAHLFKKFDLSFLPGKGNDGFITSTYYSGTLKWNFVLQTAPDTYFPYLTKIFHFLIFLFILFLVALTGTTVFVKRFSKPMKKILVNYNDSMLRNFLTGENNDCTAVETQIRITNPGPASGYIVILIEDQCPDSDVPISRLLERMNGLPLHPDKTQVGECKAQLSTINRALAAIVLVFSECSQNYNLQNFASDYAKGIYFSFGPEIRRSIYLGIGLCKEKAALLPASFQEAREALNYKITSGTHVIAYPAVMEKTDYYEYPYDIEKQLVNNILVGNMEGSRKYLEKFFCKFSVPNLSMQDDEVFNLMNQLKTAIFRGVNNLPVPIGIELDFRLDSYPDLQSVKNAFCAFCESLVTQIGERNKTDFSIQKIFAYLDRKYMDDDFNLNIAADSLCLNRNYLAKAVREHTGETFNDYINHRRIEASKQLIREENLTIEEISHRVGFNYSHYFIKVFKGIEGITPGQYREESRRRLTDSSV